MPDRGTVALPLGPVFPVGRALHGARQREVGGEAGATPGRALHPEPPTHRGHPVADVRQPAGGARARLPTWTGWLAVAGGAGLVAARFLWQVDGLWFLPYALVWVWVAATCIFLIRRRGTAPRMTPGRASSDEDRSSSR